jgi:hypothetical protein
LPIKLGGTFGNQDSSDKNDCPKLITNVVRRSEKTVAAVQRFAGYRGTSGLGQSVRDGWIYEFTAEGFYPPLTAPAVKPATIWRCAKTVSSNTGSVTISAAAASGPQLNWSKEIML